MSDFIGDWHALLILLLAGVIPNQIWRMLGLWFGGGLDEESELLVWVRAVATAILAGVIAQILVQPPGALASVPGWLRYAAVAAGFVAFLVTRRSTLAGVICGEFVMLAGKWWIRKNKPARSARVRCRCRRRFNAGRSRWHMGRSACGRSSTSVSADVNEKARW